MSSDVICAAISAAAAIICAFVGYRTERRGRREDKRAEQRAMEGRLQLAMLAANNELSVGTAMAVKSGHANGEMEKGLESVKKAQMEYRLFLEGLAIDNIRK